MRLRRALPFIVIAVGAAIATGGLLSDGRPLGFRHDWNIPFFPQALQSMWNGTDGLTVWNEQQFGTPPFYPTLAPFQSIISLMSWLGIQAGAVDRVLIVGALLIAGWGFYAFARVQNFDRIACTVAGIAYLSTPFIFTELCKGVLQGPISYACMPWVAYLFIRGSQNPGRRIEFCYAAGFLWAVSSFQVQYIAFNGVVLLALAISHKRLLSFAWTVIAAAVTDAYFIVPAIPVFGDLAQGVKEVSSESFVALWSPNLLETLRLTGCNCTFPERAASARGLLPVWQALGYLFFALSGIGFVRNRVATARIFSVVFLVAVLLATGTSLLGDGYLWIIGHVPAGAAFRESFKFTAIVAFAEALGIAAALDYAFRALASHASWLRIGVLAGCGVVVVGNGLPFFADGLETQIQRVAVPSSAARAFSFLRNRRGESRVAYLPMLVPMRPLGSAYPGIDPIISWPPRRSFGNYLSTPFSKAVASSLYHGDPSQARALLRWAGVRYIDERYWLKDEFALNTDAHNVTFDAETFNGNGLSPTALGLRSPIKDYGSERVYDLGKQNVNGVYPNRSLVVATGDLSDAGLLSHAAPLVAFASQFAETANVAGAYDSIRGVVLVNGHREDIVMSFIGRQYLISPGRFAESVNANQGWGNFDDWNTWWWYRNEYIDNLGDTALAGPLAAGQLSFPLPASSGRMKLLIKAYVGPHNGSFGVTKNGKQFAVVHTLSRLGSGFRWFDLGWLQIGDRPATLGLRNKLGETAVASVAVVPAAELVAANAAASRVLANHLVGYALTRGSQIGGVRIARAGSYHLLAIPSEGAIAKGTRYPTLQMGSRRFVSSGASVVNIPAGTVVKSDELGAGWDGLLILPVQFNADRAQANPLDENSRARYKTSAPYGSVVVLGTNYSPNWTISGNSVHLIINGFANGWIVKSAGPVEIRYKPEAFARVGRAVSAIALLAGLLILSRQVWFDVRAKKARAPS